MYQFFCDSNCELWHTTVKELGINVIRMPYIVDDQEYFYDMGEATDFKGFFQKMRDGAVPKTAALNEYAYMEYFEPVLARGEDIYYVTFSHEMSGTFNAMKNVIEQLKEKYPDREIRYKDSKLISLGSGFVTYYAALKYKEGATMDELDAYCDELIPHTATYFAVDDLTYLHRGGRVSGLSRVVGNLLGIKPILHFNEEGKIVNISKEKGLRKALTALLNYMKTKGSELDKYKVFVLHADCEKEATDFIAQIKTQFGDLDITLQPIGPVIGSHCGPGTIGLIFHAKEK
ncbi:MAG: DegV family protein [Clostridia bacterium]|nr:DegV family protein [Clostridia bacterium]